MRIDRTDIVERRRSEQVEEVSQITSILDEIFDDVNIVTMIMADVAFCNAIAKTYTFRYHDGEWNAIFDLENMEINFKNGSDYDVTDRILEMGYFSMLIEGIDEENDEITRETLKFSDHYETFLQGNAVYVIDS